MSYQIRAVSASGTQWRSDVKMHTDIRDLEEICIAQSISADAGRDAEAASFSLINEAALEEPLQRSPPHDDGICVTATQPEHCAELQAGLRAWLKEMTKDKTFDMGYIHVHDDPRSMGRALEKLKSAHWRLSRDLPSRFNLCSLTTLKSCDRCSRRYGHAVRHPLDSELLSNIGTQGITMLTFLHTSTRADGSRTNALECLLLSHRDEDTSNIEKTQSALKKFISKREELYNMLVEKDPIGQSLEYRRHTKATLRKMQKALSWRIASLSETSSDAAQGSVEDVVLDAPHDAFAYMTDGDDVMRILHHCATDRSTKWILASSLPGTAESSLAWIDIICKQLQVTPDLLPECQQPLADLIPEEQ